MADEWRYFCMMHPMPMSIVEEEKIPVFDPLDMYKSKGRMTRYV